MNELNGKIIENNKQIVEYESQIKKTKQKSKLLNNLDNGIISLAIISGLSIFVISPLASIPCIVSLGGSFLVSKKQKKYEKDLNKLIVNRGILMTENGKIRWEIKNLEENLNKETDITPITKMTAGISHRPKVKTLTSN